MLYQIFGRPSQTGSTPLSQCDEWSFLFFFFFLLLFLFCNLVSTLPCSRTLTVKLCERGEPGIFSRVSSVNGPVDLIVCGHTRDSEQEKEQKQQATYFMYLAIEGRISYTLSIEHGWTTCKTLPFCSVPVLIKSCLRRKATRLSPHIHIRFPGLDWVWGNLFCVSLIDSQLRLLMNLFKVQWIFYSWHHTKPTSVRNKSWYIKDSCWV